MNNTINYLKSKEWSMGNGQCPECCGCKPRKGWWTETVGHKLNCKLAKSLEEIGEKVVWEHFNHSKRRREHLKFFNSLMPVKLLK